LVLPCFGRVFGVREVFGDRKEIFRWVGDDFISTRAIGLNG
jgi:hypothetical protein